MKCPLSQGTVSILIGCYCQVHTLFVALAWRKLYGRWPEPWELACIALHDVGHLGKQYIDNPAEKAEHWRLGAEIAGYLLGSAGYEMCAGHCGTSGEPKSLLYKADKLSWTFAPYWWLRWQCFVEPFNRTGETSHNYVKKFQAWVKENCNGEWRDTHDAIRDIENEEKCNR